MKTQETGMRMIIHVDRWQANREMHARLIAAWWREQVSRTAVESSEDETKRLDGVVQAAQRWVLRDTDAEHRRQR